MSFLLDTNVVSEPRKPTPHSDVISWYRRVASRDLFISALVVGEVQRGIEHRRRRDAEQALALQTWWDSTLSDFGDRVLPVTGAIAAVWARLTVPDPLPIIDGLMAATALVHGMTFVTRNPADVERTGVELLNPFAP